MKNKTVTISALIAAYGLYKTIQFKTTTPNMSEAEQKIAGTSILLGLFGMGIGYIFKK